MKVLKFESLNTTDLYDSDYIVDTVWSRPYEYQFVVDTINKLKTSEDIKIHNTSWGFEGVHVIFKNKLEQLFGIENCTNTDIKTGYEPNSEFYDITVLDSKFSNMFDFVLNVSTLEEVTGDHLQFFHNLYDQVKPNGYLIITFDLYGDDSGLQLKKFEELFKQKYIEHNNYINPINSANSTQRFPVELKCGAMIVKKTKND